MNCSNRVSHVLTHGDSLYALAKHYHTTVQAIMALNSGLDPYNLQVGTTIVICPGNGYKPPSGNGNLVHECGHVLELSNRMRLAWSQHVYWTRMVLISIAQRLQDLSATENRLMQNPQDIAVIFGEVYGREAQNTIQKLLTEHLQLGGQIITALRDKRSNEAEALIEKWYVNADQMAEAFASLSPDFDYEDLKRMLHEHLDETTNEVALRLEGNYAGDVNAFNKVESQAMDMADYFTSTILKHKS